MQEQGVAAVHGGRGGWAEEMERVKGDGCPGAGAVGRTPGWCGSGKQGLCGRAPPALPPPSLQTTPTAQAQLGPRFKLGAQEAIRSISVDTEVEIHFLLKCTESVAGGDK